MAGGRQHIGGDRTALHFRDARTPTRRVLQSCEDDVLVMVDHLGPHLQLWRDSCEALEGLGVAVRSEEEGSQQRTFYSRLV